MSVELLRKACSYYSQRKVGSMIGKSATTVNLLLKGKYPKPDKLLQKVNDVFKDLEDSKCDCPVLGELHIEVCQKYYAWAQGNTIHKDRLYRKVKEHCKNCIQRGR